jgi:peptidoglycan/LPS O-acetylase OafA/YrhL
MYATLWQRDGNWIANSADSFFVRTWRFNLVTLAFALLLPLASGWKVGRENFATQSVRKIALWSYAIYLVQHPLSRLLMPKMFTDWQTSATHAWLLFAALFAAIIVVSALLHHGFEAPCTRLREKIGPPVRRLFGQTTDLQ